MDLSDYVKEFRGLQKTQKIRVADFCRERMLDYYEMVEALKKDKFRSEMPAEQIDREARWEDCILVNRVFLVLNKNDYYV